MITAKDVRKEIREAGDIVNDEKATVSDKIKALYKLITVALKVELSTRLNVVRIMEKLGVEKVEPRRSKGTDEKKEENK